MANFFKALGAAAPQAALNTASNLITAGFNQAFYKSNARFEAELAEQAAQRDYQRQLDFWEMQNAYNTPEMQVRRMREAGLNPVEATDSGNSASLSSTPSSKGSSAPGGGMTAPQFDLMDVLHTLTDIDNMSKEGDLLTQQYSMGVKDLLLRDLEVRMKKLGLVEMGENIERARYINRQLRFDYRKSLVNFPLELIEKNNAINAGILNNEALVLKNWFQRASNKTFDDTGYLPGTASMPGSVQAVVAKYLDMMLSNFINNKSSTPEPITFGNPTGRKRPKYQPSVPTSSTGTGYFPPMIYLP